MKQASNNSSRRSFRLTDKGVAFVLDHRAKLGAIPENQNLSRHEKSHVDLVNEEIDLFEQEQAAKELSKSDKLAILMDCSDRLHQRWLAAWDAHKATPVNHVRRITTIAKLNSIHKACIRVTSKIAQLLDV